MNESSFWNVTVPRVLSSYAITIFAILWLGFFISLIANREWLDLLWNWVQTLPTVAQIIAWVFFTPVMTVLWIWDSSWSVLIRVLAFAGIAGWTSLAVSSFVKALRQFCICRQVSEHAPSQDWKNPRSRTHKLKRPARSCGIDTSRNAASGQFQVNIDPEMTANTHLCLTAC